jgi:hypothetical protein
LINENNFYFEIEENERNNFKLKMSDQFDELFDEMNNNKESIKIVKNIKESFVSIEYLKDNNMLKNGSFIMNNNKVSSIHSFSFKNKETILVNNKTFISFKKRNEFEKKIERGIDRNSVVKDELTYLRDNKNSYIPF